MKTLEFTDIKRIGHTSFDIEEGTAFICNLLTCNIESMLLREILHSTEYKIVEEEDFVWGKNICDWIIKTNIPYSVYQNL